MGKENDKTPVILKVIAFLLIGMLIGLIMGIYVMNNLGNSTIRDRVLHNTCVKLYGGDYTYYDTPINDETFVCVKFFGDKKVIT